MDVQEMGESCLYCGENTSPAIPRHHTLVLKDVSASDLLAQAYFSVEIWAAYNQTGYVLDMSLLWSYQALVGA